jgi:DNA-binding MarR family transcriptional regulator
MTEAKKLINELLVDLFNRILAIEGEELKKAGVTLSMNEVHVLEAILVVEEPSMTYIAAKLGITVGSLTTAVNTLVQKGYVTRYRLPEDRRKVLVRLEQSADDVLRIHQIYHDKMIAAIFEDLKVGEDEILINSLQKVATYFRK